MKGNVPITFPPISSSFHSPVITWYEVTLPRKSESPIVSDPRTELDLKEKVLYGIVISVTSRVSLILYPTKSVTGVKGSYPIVSVGKKYDPPKS